MNKNAEPQSARPRSTSARTDRRQRVWYSLISSILGKRMVTPPKFKLRVEVEPGPKPSIARLATARTAFVGRTLRGPVGRALLVKSFAEFQQTFGGLWQPAPLGYAVEQFFDNGGREVLIVRVVNGARAASLNLSAGDSFLNLEALRPGKAEFLRASVDYDAIPPSDTKHFNLTIQRVRAQGTSQVDDQEIFRRVSMLPGSDTYLATAIGTSQLVKFTGALPRCRPDRTVNPSSGVAHAYVQSNSDGDDGAPLCDYDVIGSEVEGTGIFALSGVDYFNFLCIPPLSRDKDPGLPVLLVAERYCALRRALLIVDPPAHWHTADDALRGLKTWQLTSENALMYFPRILAQDKLRGQVEAFAPCGAVAGMLARSDEIFPLWDPKRNDEAVPRPGYRPTCVVSDERRDKLTRMGVNTIQAVRSAVRSGTIPRTFAAGRAVSADWQYLSARRLALFIVNCIERGTRWAANAPAHSEIGGLLAQRVRVFFEGLYVAGAFGTRRVDDAYFVVVDERANAQGSSAAQFQFLIGFAAAHGSGLHSFRITHGPNGTQVQTVSTNRLNLAAHSPAELDWVERG